ncbi:Ig-like domain-containing protein [Mesobacillus foraminis]|uniref:Ig-like domain-containing protein n=1 Tax=Mesobacillus foraminis TaxID=279826 RepID=UPI00399FA338
MKRLFTLLLAALFIFTFSFSDVAEAATEFEDNDSFGTATKLTLSKNTDGTYTSKVTGIISDDYDRDYYMLTLINPGKISVKMDRKAGTKFNVALHNAGQDLMESYYTDYDPTTGVLEIFAQGLDKGIYYISVEYYDGNSSKVPYTLQVDFTLSSVYEREFNNDMSQANWISLNTVYNGYADDYYSDYYAFSTSQPGEIIIDLNNNPQTRYYVELLTKNGTLLESWYTDYGDNYDLATIIHTGLTPGNYYIRINAEDGDTENIPYRFKVNFSPHTYFEQEENDTPATATPLSLNTQYKGVISFNNDNDYYRVSVPKDMHLALYLTRTPNTRFEVSVSNQSFSSNQYHYTSFGSNAISHLANLDLKAGTYFINISHYDGEDNKVPYSLKMIERDTTPPAAPKVNAVTDKSTTLSGTAEANSTVHLQVGSKVVKKATATKDGKFSFSISKYKGGTTLVVFARDSSGNQSKSTTIKVKDTTPPAAPKINTVTDKRQK